MSLTGQSNGSIRELIRQARRRFFLNVAVAQAALAGSVGMAGVILLLVFGAQFLDWRWLAFLAILTFPLAYFRTARRVPSPYRVAQIVDARLQLRDSISTALYFSDHAEPGRGSESMRLAQIVESESIGSGIDPKAAVPLTRPRMLSALGSLFMVAAILFGLRYGVQHRMDLSRPLARILIDAFGGGNADKRADLKRNKRFPMEIWNQMAQDDSFGPDSQFKEGEGPEGLAPENAVDGDLKQAGDDQTDSDADQSGGDGEKESDGSKAKGDGGEESDEAGSSSDKDGDPSSKEGENQGGKQPTNSSENASLSSKIKDAMSSLMNSLRPKDGQNSQSTPGKSGDSKSQQAKSGQKASSKGEKKSGDQASGPEDGQQGDAESGQPGEGKGSSQSSDGQTGGDGSSGAGKQDGSKDTKLAQQLEAMGKISEIFGKRSANVTGEVTIEVTSSKQAVRSPLAEGKAAHGEATGEINRDEVPAAFQDYVQQYFEQVRKPAKGSGTGKGSTPPSP